MSFDECVLNAHCRFKLAEPAYKYLIEYTKAGHIGYRLVKTNDKHRQIYPTKFVNEKHFSRCTGPIIVVVIRI